MTEAIMAQKTCKRCSQTKPISDFGRKRTNKSGYRNTCKACRYKPVNGVLIAFKRQNTARKLCPTCGVIKPFSEFYQKRNTEDGRSYNCKGCGKYEKQCTMCGEIKPTTEFWKNSLTVDGFASQCKYCLYNVRYKNGPYKETRRKYAEAHADKIKAWKTKNAKLYQSRIPYNIQRRRYTLRRHFNMTPEEFDKLLELQNGKCAICKTTEPGGRFSTFHVDHDHQTGRVRGLLCSICNLTLGKVRDRKDWLLAALAYIETPPAHNFDKEFHHATSNIGRSSDSF